MNFGVIKVKYCITLCFSHYEANSQGSVKAPVILKYRTNQEYQLHFDLINYSDEKL